MIYRNFLIPCEFIEEALRLIRAEVRVSKATDVEGR